MKKAAIPNNEISRLKALYQYDVLDTDAEQVFDDLTELASEICGTPIALISLIDQDRQWFKSKVGLSASETSRDIAFCAHAIHQEDIFAVSDTLLDERFKDNPLVTDDPSIRSYFGAPLITPEGYAIGTLCAISDKPNKLSDRQLNALKILGRQVIAQLQLRLKVKEVELANMHKTEFLSNLSHELRTPLNAIISFSQLMLFDRKYELPKKHMQYLKHLDFSGKRLLDLVNSVLDLNKIDSGKLVLEEDHLETNEYLESITSMIIALAKSKSINIDFKIEANDINYFIADETRLTQIILNLASNAIKFSKNGQTVSIHISFCGQKMTIAVRDEGIGIAQEDIPLLFQKFRRVGSSTNEEGAGLGLMITKSLVELMQGTIKLNSRLGEGSLFKVVLPLRKSEASATQIKTRDPLKRFDTNAIVLVVEDNYINQEVAKALFHAIGLVVEVCESGEEAVELAKAKHFDLIFMDLNLPGIDGFEASKKITANNSEQKIVALSADVFASSAPELKRSGILSCLTKPAPKAQLIATLNQYAPKP